MGNNDDTLDVRLVVYFYLTTFNSVLDVVFQDERIVLGAVAVMKGFVCYHLHTLPSSFMAVCLLMTVSYWFILRAPAIWDSTIWSMQTDTVVALWLLFGRKKNHGSMQHLCSTVTQMFCWYYAAAGFFKINSHFLDPDASCATVFLIQHVTYYLGSWVSHETIVSMCKMLKPWAPTATLSIELSMAGFLILGQVVQSRPWTNMGLLLILYFHLAVCLTPEPLDISMFALQCGSRLIMAADPTALEATLRAVVDPNVPYLIVFAIVWTAYGILTDFTPLNWAFAGYVPVLLLHTIAIQKCTTKNTSSETTTRKPLWSYCAIFVAFFYSFGTIILGLQEEATCNMFANLKIHGGSNHYLVPTGLLLTGNEIRIQQTNSWWFTTTYPADFSHIVEPEQAKSVLEAIGNPAPFYFNGGANRVLGLFQKGYVAHNGIFVPYTVPTIEFKRMFAEAVVHDKSFTLEYVELPGRTGDEQWRATASLRTVKVEVRDGKVTRCKANGRACADDDLVYQYDDIPWLQRKFSMYHGYPIVFNEDGKVRKSITCFGP